MAKIVLVGAGSFVFGRDFIADIMLYPKLGGSTLMLMDVDKERLDLATAFARKLTEQNKLKLKIESTTDRREALDGADYVITSIRAGGWKAQQVLREITMKHGEEIQPDALGPGGIFGGLCQIPAILEICHDMEKVCPDAWLLNYCNPLAIICWAINDYSTIKNVGLCPNPTGGSQRFGRVLGLPPEDIYYSVAGLNHFSWFLDILYKGEDCYPRLRELYKDPDSHLKPLYPGGHLDPVEIEIFKTFGYFDTGGGHTSIYLPYFRRTPEIVERYRMGDNSRMYNEAPLNSAKQDAEIRQQLKSGKKFELSSEHRFTVIAAQVINAIETNTQTRIFGNVKNNGLITNLLEGCVVEVPCMVDRGGVHPAYVGDLPTQLAALNSSSVYVQKMAVEGIVEKDKNKVQQSIVLDPLTNSMLSIDEIKQMVAEIFKAEKEFLKGYK